jgi:hypothetical protein
MICMVWNLAYINLKRWIYRNSYQMSDITCLSRHTESKLSLAIEKLNDIRLDKNAKWHAKFLSITFPIKFYLNVLTVHGEVLRKLALNILYAFVRYWMFFFYDNWEIWNEVLFKMV